MHVSEGLGNAETPHRGDLIADAERCGRLRVPSREALREIDALQQRLFVKLRDAYGDAYYAKLLSLKIANLALAKYHFVNRHVRVFSQPVTLMHDPSNACQLQCPGCVHTENRDYAKGFLWPAATMKVIDFEKIMRGVGPFALNVVYYNYGEPLLNKNISEFLRVSNGYGLTSVFSTNLSLRFDVDRFVDAGPENVILSIDGVSQTSYSRYRKRGNIDLVLENVRKLVQARRRLGVNRPRLVWQFLTFEHNVHEVEAAISLGKELGVDEVNVGTPFDVSIDDPGVHVAQSDRKGRHVFNPWQPRSSELALSRIVRHEEVEQAFDEGWLRRHQGVDTDESARPESSTCPWLYWNMTIDAAKRVMPCCMAPTTEHNVVYDDMNRAPADPFNAKGFRLSREAFAHRASFEERTRGTPPAALPFCASCTLAPSMSYDPAAAVGDIGSLDFRLALGRDEAAWQALARWWD